MNTPVLFSPCCQGDMSDLNPIIYSCSLNPIIYFCWSMKDVRLDCFGKTDPQPQAPDEEASSRIPGRKRGLLGFKVPGEFEADPDEVG